LYAFRHTSGPVDLAFTDRYGGVSGVPFDELNLAIEGDDDARAREENLRLLVADFAPGDTVADLRQMHGAAVVVAGDAPDRAEADALVTDRPDTTLLVRAADCVPVLLADADARVVGAAHCGRSGLAAGVVPATITLMLDLGAVAVTAWVGPHVCGACYEVPAEMQADVGRLVPAAVATTSWGAPSLDLGAGVIAQLEAEGVTVHDVSRCTRESADLYSHRRDGVRAGRLAGVIRFGT
jgi:YfiH family protein